MTTDHPPPAANSERRPTSGILRNVTSNWASLVVGIVLSFVIAPLTVHSLGNVYYGIWTLLMQFTGYLWLFDFGVRESVIKYVAQYHASEQHDELVSTVRTAVSMYSVVAVVALLMIALLALALPHFFNIPAEAVGTARLTAILFGATVAQGFVFNVFVGVLMGLQKFYLMARLGIVFAVARAALIVVLLSAGYGIIMLALVQFVMTLASNLLVYRMCITHLPHLSVRFVRPQRAEAFKLLNYGKYVLITNLGDKFIFATSSLVIGVFMPISALTYYAIGGSLTEHLRSFITSMASILNPLASSLEARRETDTLAAVFMTGAKVAMILGLPVCIGFILLGERFITLWMGEAYGPTAGLILAVLASGYLIGLPFYTISGVLYGLGKHRIVAWSRVSEGIVNLCLSVWLVRHYGLVGVALGTVIPHAIVVVGILPAFLPKLLRIDLREYYASTYGRPFLASIPFGIACLFVERVVRPADLVSFFAFVIVSLLAYVVPCWFLALAPRERRHLSGAVRRRLQPRIA
jgi:O-antigen/teichoic acid export membrane protein